MQSKLGVAILGFDHWYWAYNLATALQTSPRGRLVAAWDAAAERRRAVAEAYGVPEVQEPAAILERRDVDVVVVASTTAMHRDLAMQVIASGKGLICNKPLARTVAEGREIVEEAERAGVTVAVTQMGWRHAPAFRELRGLIERGVVGDVLEVSLLTRSSLPAGAPHSPDPGWFIQRSQAAGGAFVDHGVYHLDLLQWMLGAKVEEVLWAKMARLQHKDLELEDYGAACVRLTDGAVALFEQTWNAPGFGPAIELRGTRGEAYADLGRQPSVGYLEVGGRKTSLPVGDGDLYKDSLEELLEAFATGTRPPAEAKDGLDVLEACARIYRAAGWDAPIAAGAGARK